MENQNKHLTSEEADRGEGLKKQREYNEKYTNQNEVIADESGNTSEKSSEDDNINDAGYKQKEGEEMSGERTRKTVEENKEKGISEGSPDERVVDRESEKGSESNTITENTQDRVTLDPSQRSVV